MANESQIKLEIKEEIDLDYPNVSHTNLYDEFAGGSIKEEPAENILQEKRRRSNRLPTITEKLRRHLSENLVARRNNVKIEIKEEYPFDSALEFDRKTRVLEDLETNIDIKDEVVNDPIFEKPKKIPNPVALFSLRKQKERSGHKKHKKHKMGPKYLECDCCPLKFRNRQKLLTHLQSHFPRLQIVDPEEGKSGNQEKINKELSQKKIYKRRRKAKKISDCPTCNRSFPSKRSLVKHQQKAHDQKPLWERKFPEYFRENNFKKNQSGISNTCEICGVEMASRNSLRNHYYIHLNLAKFTCDICNKKFNFKNHLKQVR